MYISKIDGEAWWCCPHCKNRIITHKKTGDVVINKHVFFDSEVIKAPIGDRPGITYLNSLWVGQCLSCSGRYTAIEINILSAPDDEDSFEYVLLNKPMGEPTNYVCNDDGVTDNGEYKDCCKCSLNLYDTPLGKLCHFLLCVEPIYTDKGSALVDFVGVLDCVNDDRYNKAKNTVTQRFDRFQDICINVNHHLEQDELSRRSVMSKSDKQRFRMRIGGEVILWDYLKTDKGIVNIGAEVTVKNPDLYDRISHYALLHGEDLQGMFKNDKYLYMSCFIRDVAAFRNEFESEEVLKPLFSHGKGDASEFVISFPEKRNFDDKE
ncbi:hypothetical protein [Candidatus Sodalis sp. SoCistrobi]|uniref:hypothetical protein n=1 Tax=Candidatus Sodalis sp. SoCistrobi TaxID=1922216 RepID=UPI0020B8E128|nr:hypothetical protein [Candidatus Sodalis sp. SoCistrobi]